MNQVLYISTDGLRPDALGAAHTPNFQALMKRGSYSLNAQSVMPSVTLPCHMSIFHSVPPERHGTTTNTYSPMVRPIKGLIDVLSDANKRCASFFSWEPLRDISRPQSLKHATFIAYQGNPEVSDKLIVEKALPYLRNAAFDFSFLYLGAIDEVGHDHVWMSQRYLKQVEMTDELLGMVLESLPSETTVILHSDHGGHDRSHGTERVEDMTIPWMISGQGIKENFEISGAISVLDTAPTIAHLLGVQAPSQWEGRVVSKAFR